MRAPRRANLPRATRKFAWTRAIFSQTPRIWQAVVRALPGRPVYLRDVADKIVDGPAEPQDYVSVRHHACKRASAAPQQDILR